MGENLHKDHRNRVLDDFIKNGFDIHTPPHKILEFLLFYCIQRKDTNPLAHEMINKYGSLSGVLDAPLEELASMKEMSLRSAALLKLIIPLSNIYSFDKAHNVKSFGSLSQIDEYLFDRMRNYNTEKMAILLLNADGSFKSFDILFEGTVDSVSVSVRDIIKTCLDKGGVIAALAHNHPSGVAIPSMEDTTITERIATALSNVGLRLIDHVIVVNNDYVSMAESPEYSHIFKINKTE